MNDQGAGGNISITNVNIVEQRGGCGAGCGTGCAAFVCIVFVLGAIALAIEWPWLLGSWIAVQLGAGLDSTARAVVGWMFEVPYLVFLIAAAVAYFRRL